MKQQIQKTIHFNAPVEKVVNCENFTYANQPTGESKTSPVSVKMPYSVKQQIQDFCFENDLSVSQLLRDAANFYCTYFTQKEKFKKYEAAVLNLLNNLP